MIPNQLRAGSAYVWQERAKAADGSTYEYTLFNASGVYTITGGEKAFALNSADTASWAPGVYAWTLRAVDGDGNKAEVAKGHVEILPNPDLHPGGLDGRSHARRVLDAIEATLEGRATDDMAEITIRGRTIKQTPLVDLMKLRDVYRRDVAAEARAERLGQGLPDNRFRRVRFT
jgi:hypothetical protein